MVPRQKVCFLLVHIIECPSKDDVEACPAVHKHSVELDLADCGRHHECMPPWLRHAIGMVLSGQSDRIFRPLEILGSDDHRCVDLPSSQLLPPLRLLHRSAPEYHVQLCIQLLEI